MYPGECDGEVGNPEIPMVADEKPPKKHALLSNGLGKGQHTGKLLENNCSTPARVETVRVSITAQWCKHSCLSRYRGNHMGAAMWHLCLLQPGSISRAGSLNSHYHPVVTSVSPHWPSVETRLHLHLEIIKQTHPSPSAVWEALLTKYLSKIDPLSPFTCFRYFISSHAS